MGYTTSMDYTTGKLNAPNSCLIKLLYTPLDVECLELIKAC